MMRYLQARLASTLLASTLLAIVLLAGGVLLASGSLAQAEVSPSPIGKKVADFTLPNTYAKNVALADYSGKPVVLAFLGTECPLARNYALRLRELAAEFESKGVVFLGIWSNQQDSLTEIAAFAKQFELPFPMLKDNQNELADAVGAERTPEVFLLDANRVVRYWGRIDDQYGLTTGSGYAKPKLKSPYLADAIGEVLAGKEVSLAVVKSEGCLIGRVAKVQPHGDVTYANQVSRLLQSRCVSCHRPNEVAPFSLTSYEETIGWAPMIKEVVTSERMPPWFADKRHGHFANDARLTDAERQTLCTWVDNGCPLGNVKDMPEPPKFVDGWQIGEPDQILYMDDKPFLVQAEGTVPYQNFIVDPGWTEDKWIVAAEARPGNRAVVHHIFVTPIAPAGRPAGASSFAAVGSYAPGLPPLVYPPGTAMVVPAGSKLRFQMHYTPAGVAMEDLSLLGFKFAKKEDVKKLARNAIVNNIMVRIPPGDPNHKMEANYKVSKDYLLLELTPHMHVRGKSFKFEANYPDGTAEVLLDVPHYDFNWQLRYILSEPKLLPQGTVVHSTAHYDNSADNPANPDPTKLVTFGEQTWNEMMVGALVGVDPYEDLTAARAANAGTESATPATPK